MTCVCPYDIAAHAPNWGGRTPGSQTPGVPATLGLNVQMDGGRKMLQNCSKNTPPQHLNITTMNESEAPPGRAGTVAARPQRRPQPQRYCTCGTSRQFSALSGHPGLSLHNDRHVKHDMRLQLRNLSGLPTRQDHGDLSLRHERDVDDLRWTATAGQQYAAPSNHASVVAQHGRNDLTQELFQSVFCTIALWVPRLRCTTGASTTRKNAATAESPWSFEQEEDHGNRPLHHDKAWTTENQA